MCDHNPRQLPYRKPEMQDPCPSAPDQDRGSKYLPSKLRRRNNSHRHQEKVRCYDNDQVALSEDGARKKITGHKRQKRWKESEQGETDELSAILGFAGEAEYNRNEKQNQA